MPRGKKQGRSRMGFLPMLRELFVMGAPEFDTGSRLNDQWEGGMDLVASAKETGMISVQALQKCFPELVQLEATVPAVVLEGIRRALAVFRFIEAREESWGVKIQYEAGKEKGKGGRPQAASSDEPTTRKTKRRRKTRRGRKTGKAKKQKEVAAPAQTSTPAAKGSRREGSIASKIIDAVGGEEVAQEKIQALYDKFGNVPLLAEFFKAKKGIEVTNANMAFILKGLKVKTTRKGK